MAIIQAFTALWMIQIEQMVVILDFCQKMKKNKTYMFLCINCISKSREANDHSIQYICETIGYEKLSTFFSFPNVNSFLERLIAYIGNFYVICKLSYTNNLTKTISKYIPPHKCEHKWLPDVKFPPILLYWMSTS